MIKFENIYVKKKDKVVLNGISGEIKEGDKILLTGPSGSGKTTLLKTLLFFDYPESESILYKNSRVNKKNIRQYREIFAYIGQNPPAYNGSTGSLLRFMVRDLNDKEYKLTNLMEYYLLSPELLKSPFLSLSNGEKQRFNIIMSLLMERKIYLLDEITSNLDPENVQKTIDCFLNENFTCLVISHQKEWKKFATRHWILKGNLEEKQ